ncbi:MAG: DNA-3-methyladenine glycosylase I [Flavobacteriales bacterium]|nr:DNA-3-methyladenine glycosylase I [Flavobacteriales bacterium]
MNRCEWCGSDPLYVAYHDKEWGVPVKEDQKMFEFLILETFQAGLSWITILRKRENFRKAFDQFDYKIVAKYDDAKIEKLMMDSGIIRNHLKIRAAISNAQAYIEVQKEFGTFCDYIWGFVDHHPIQNNIQSISELPAKTELAEKISKDLKRRGFKFVGPTVVYAHMQATGMVNDHVLKCERHQQLQNV